MNMKLEGNGEDQLGEFVNENNLVDAIQVFHGLFGMGV
jgi:hypothetical protein